VEDKPLDLFRQLLVRPCPGFTFDEQIIEGVDLNLEQVALRNLDFFQLLRLGWRRETNTQSLDTRDRSGDQKEHQQQERNICHRSIRNFRCRTWHNKIILVPY